MDDTAQTLLVAIDESAHADTVVKAAIRYAVDLRMKILFLFVVDATGFHFDDADGKLNLLVQTEQLAEQKKLTGYVDQAKASRVFAAASKVMLGNPKEEIIAQGMDSSIFALMIGAQGANAIDASSLGSTADFLIHHFSKTVIVVR
ncbi:universal stress protein [Furfurilactobacillus entadae]|uniref:universal stress protein n=1 Tax=Furfurilactobacillus entadae TaxID=2922307 RepID=UPI0035E6B52B